MENFTLKSPDFQAVSPQAFASGLWKKNDQNKRYRSARGALQRSKKRYSENIPQLSTEKVDNFFPMKKRSSSASSYLTGHHPVSGSQHITLFILQSE
ncbi:hypothetical protein [Pantoea sp. PGP6]